MNYDMQTWNNMSRESLGKKRRLSFYIAFYWNSIVALFAKAFTKVRFLMSWALERWGVVWTGPQVQLETMTPLSRHNANETGELSTSTMRSMGRPKRRKSSSSERGMLVMHGQGTKPPFIFGTVFLSSLSCLNTLPWGKHHRVPRNADLKFVKKHGKGFGKKQNASNINT